MGAGGAPMGAGVLWSARIDERALESSQGTVDAKGRAQGVEDKLSFVELTLPPASLAGWRRSEAKRSGASSFYMT